MSIVNGYNTDGTYLALGSELAKQLASTQNEWTGAADKVGAALEESQDLLEQAFTVQDGSAAAKALGTKLGINTSNAEALQVVAKDNFERRNRAMELLSNILDKADQLARGIIANIGK